MSESFVTYRKGHPVAYPAPKAPEFVQRPVRGPSDDSERIPLALATGESYSELAGEYTAYAHRGGLNRNFLPYDGPHFGVKTNKPDQGMEGAHQYAVPQFDFPQFPPMPATATPQRIVYPM